MGVIMEFAHFLVTPTLVENPELAGVFLHNKSNVLEARTRVGGRVYTLRGQFADDLYAEAGATNVFDNHDWTGTRGMLEAYLGGERARRVSGSRVARSSRRHSRGRLMALMQTSNVQETERDCRAVGRTFTESHCP